MARRRFNEMQTEEQRDAARQTCPAFASDDDGLPDPIQESDLDRQPHPGRDTTGRAGFDGGERS
jgi:hypothetical protein